MAAWAACAAAMICWPNEKMETRLVIWSISMELFPPVLPAFGPGEVEHAEADIAVGAGVTQPRKAGWNTCELKVIMKQLLLRLCPPLAVRTTDGRQVFADKLL